MAVNQSGCWSELLAKMGQDNGDRDERPGSTPEPFEVFYLREYPKVVGLLHGLLGSRLVAEELAQETGRRPGRRVRHHPGPKGPQAANVRPVVAK
jgi:hypothetical protein